MFDTRLKELANTLVEGDYACQKRVSQSVYILEEMSELSKEILKDQRFKGDIDHIKEEMADVLCTILTYAVDKGINVDELRDIMIEKFKSGINRFYGGEQ